MWSVAYSARLCMRWCSPWIGWAVPKEACAARLRVQRGDVIAQISVDMATHYDKQSVQTRASYSLAAKFQTDRLARCKEQPETPALEEASGTQLGQARKTQMRRIVTGESYLRAHGTCKFLYEIAQEQMTRKIRSLCRSTRDNNKSTVLAALI